MNSYPYDLPGRPNWGSTLEEFVPYLERTGFRNLEVHPTEAIMRDVERRRASDELEMIETVVGSTHETFNDGTGLLGRVADHRGVRRPLSSIGAMVTLQRSLPRPVQAVHYPQKGGARLQIGPIPILSDYPGAFPIVQPAAEVYRDFYVEDEELLLARLHQLGHVGTCEDTVHRRRRAQDGTSPPPLWDVWPQRFASGNTYQMHVASDRFDMEGRDPELAAKSCEEYKAFTSGDWRRAYNTEMGEMIVAAVENYVPPADLLRMVGAPVLRSVAELAPRPGALLTRTAQHIRFVENMAEIVRQTGATPLLWGDAIPECTPDKRA